MDSCDTVTRKVLGVFAEALGDRVGRLDPSVLAHQAMAAITAALSDEHGTQKASEIALHLADWNWDAAFIVALHLFPERFSKEEIAAGVDLFLTHAPNHIRAACQLTGTYVWESFPDTVENQ